MQNENADVVVIGAGPAGATAAILLKRARPAARIVLLERETFPRHHIGESTLPDANPVLHKLGVLPALESAGFVRKCGITYKWRSDRPIFSENFAKGIIADGIPDHSWQVDRSAYDAVLLARAREVGVDVRQPWAVTQVVKSGERVVGVVAAPRDEPGTEPHTILAGHVVDCSGQARLLGRLLGVANVEHDLGDLAIYRYYDAADWPTELVGTRDYSKIFFAAVPAGWIWYIPLSTDRVSVGLVTRRELVRGRDLDELFEEQLALVPELGPPLASAHAVAPPGSSRAADESAPPHRRFTSTIQNWSYQHASVAGPGYYLAGDAAAFVDPILSSGILLAHRAGLAVANAIATEWAVPEIDVPRLREAYETFYGDLTRGFIVMARWWYDQREAGIEDWWKKAAILTREARPAVTLDDLAAFMHFVAGYLADFRFVHIGPSFGAEGFAVCVDGLTGTPNARGAFRGRPEDRHKRLRRRFAEVDPTLSYLATFVETDRWWDLPAARFVVGAEVRTYRMPVTWDHDGVPWTDAARAALSALLTSVDDQRHLDDVIASALLRLDPRQSPLARTMLQRMCADLLSLGVLESDDVPSRIGSAASPFPAPAGRLAPLFDSFEIVFGDGVGDTAKGQLADVVFTSPRGTWSYRLPFVIGQRVSANPQEAAQATRLLLQSAREGATVDAALQTTVRQLGTSGRAARDLASIVLRDLVSIDVLKVV